MHVGRRFADPDLQHHLEELVVAHRLALRLAEDQAGRSSSAAALPAGYLGAIHYEWNETARAGEILGERFGTAIETSPIGSLTRFCLTAARLAALRGERDEAYRTLEQAAAVARDRDWLRMLTACEGEMD